MMLQELNAKIALVVVQFFYFWITFQFHMDQNLTCSSLYLAPSQPFHQRQPSLDHPVGLKIIYMLLPGLMANYMSCVI
uniref:Uncharacterized protein n=1 Tax=Octopus bimaculoides TaxID=37653 RepID=A0A0L8GX99_OCTBM